jgi:hypothetical protein
VTKFETRTLTGLVINHRNAGCLSQLPSSSCKAQLQTAKGTRTAGAFIEWNTCHTCHEDGCAIQPNIPSSVHFPDVLCGSLAPLIGRSLHFLATWRKGGKVRSLWSMTRVTEGAQGSGLNSKMAASRKLAVRKGLVELHLVEDPAGRILCVQRSIQSSTGAPLTWFPLCSSPLLPPAAACNHRSRIRLPNYIAAIENAGPRLVIDHMGDPKQGAAAIPKVSWPSCVPLNAERPGSRYPAVSVSSVGLGDKIDKRAKFRRHSAVPLPDKVPGTGLGFVVRQ